MRFARLPFFVLPLTALVTMVLVALFMAMIDQVHLRGAYQVWQENETFAAATIALLAAMYGARPVYLQVRAQAVQAALDLLHRIEGDAEACIEARKALFEVRRVSVALAGEIIEYTVAHEPSPQDLKRATEAFMALSPQYLRALAERPTINGADQIKIATLSFVLSHRPARRRRSAGARAGRRHRARGRGERMRVHHHQAGRPVQPVVRDRRGSRAPGGGHAQARPASARRRGCVVRMRGGS